MNKKNLGQFFTTNCDYILKGFEKEVENKSIFDPFAGQGDLLSWAKRHKCFSICGGDIDPKLINDQIILNDSLKNIPYYSFILTNPPYLGSNKMTPQQKLVYPMTDYEDFYLLAMKNIILSDSKEGIIIVPVNFLSAENSDNLRKEFLDAYKITKINYFTTQVFADTTYNVIAFHFIKQDKPVEMQEINITTYPENVEKMFKLERQYNYRIAGKTLNKISNVKHSKIIRLTEQTIKKNIGLEEISGFLNDIKTIKKYKISKELKNQINNNIILLNCIDTNGTEEGWICAEDIRKYNQSCLVGKSTSRNIAYILLEGVGIGKQEEIINKFNKTLNRWRKKYDSLFLTNFRDNNRKRISFDFCYKLISYYLNN